MLALCDGYLHLYNANHLLLLGTLLEIISITFAYSLFILRLRLFFKWPSMCNFVNEVCRHRQNLRSSLPPGGCYPLSFRHYLKYA